MKYNTQYKCTYNDDDVFLETDEINDADKTFIRGCIYRQDLLNIFYMEDFNESLLNRKIGELFNSVKKQLEPCIRKAAESIVSHDLISGFMVLFSFDNLLYVHPCICEIIETDTVSSDNISRLLQIL
jgi:hypothetical protein